MPSQLLFLGIAVCLTFSTEQILVSSSSNCATTYRASWWHYPPYTNRRVNRSLMHILVREMVDDCCGGHSDVKFTNHWNNGHEMETEIDNSDTFAFPISRRVSELVTTRKVPGLDFIPAIVSPGAFYLECYDVDDRMELVTTLGGLWPLLVIMVLGIIAAGIIIWALDKRVNFQHFPKSFRHGFFEGVWWAFVSMTTVGYGDRTPSSFLGRLFGMVWIMVGIVMVAVLTSIITSSLSSFQGPVNQISRLQLAVLNGTEDEFTALSHGADIMTCNNVKCLLETMKNDYNTSGILVDHFVALHAYKDKRPFMDDLNVVWQTNIPIAHGIRVKGVSEELENCFARVAATRRSRLYNHLHHKPDRANYKKPGNIVDRFVNPNNEDNLVSIVLGATAGALLIIVVILILCDMSERHRDGFVRGKSVVGQSREKKRDEMDNSVELPCRFCGDGTSRKGKNAIAS